MGDAPSRAERNERAILDAAAAELRETGWSGIVPARIATRAGLSITPVRNRYADRPGLGAALWSKRLAEPMRDACLNLMDVLPVRDPITLAEQLCAVLEPFLYADTTLRSATELLVVSGFEPALAAAVHAELGAELAEKLAPKPSATLAGQRASLLGLAFGLALMSKHTRRDALDMSRECARFADALLHPARPARLPTKGAEHLDRGYVFDTGEAAWDSLLAATLTTIGEMGYEAATVERIARRSGFTQGVIFSRYDNKHELFVDATRRATMHALALNDAMLERIGRQRSVGIAEAFYIRETMSPSRRSPRVILLEQIRLSWHDPFIAKAFQDNLHTVRAQIDVAHPGLTREQREALLLTEFARGQGPALLAVVVPTAWELPQDVFTVPLQERGSNP